MSERSPETSTPDQIVDKIFNTRKEQQQDTDPGDITIVVQDDLPLVQVFQRGRVIGIGNSILDSLDVALQFVEDPNLVDEEIRAVIETMNFSQGD